MFSTKVKNAQNAGAKGVIIYNNQRLKTNIADIILAEVGYDN